MNELQYFITNGSKILAEADIGVFNKNLLKIWLNRGRSGYWGVYLKFTVYQYSFENDLAVILNSVPDDYVHKFLTNIFSCKIDDTIPTKHIEF